MKGGRMPHRHVLELKNSICQLMVHGARNQPSKRPWIAVEIHLPDILREPQNTLVVFQRAHHRFVCATDVGEESKPFGMVPFRFMLFGNVVYHNGTVHGECLPKRTVFGVVRSPSLALRQNVRAFTSSGAVQFCSCMKSLSGTRAARDVRGQPITFISTPMFNFAHFLVSNRRCSNQKRTHHHPVRSNRQSRTIAEFGGSSGRCD
jgi:hypothetical protein